VHCAARVVDVGAACGMTGVIGAAWGAAEVVGTTRGAAIVGEAGDECPTKGLPTSIPWVV
jgi:hypothetical protein